MATPSRELADVLAARRARIAAAETAAAVAASQHVPSRQAASPNSSMLPGPGLRFAPRSSVAASSVTRAAPAVAPPVPAIIESAWEAHLPPAPSGALGLPSASHIVLTIRAQEAPPQAPPSRPSPAEATPSGAGAAAASSGAPATATATSAAAPARASPSPTLAPAPAAPSSWAVSIPLLRVEQYKAGLFGFMRAWAPARIAMRRQNHAFRITEAHTACFCLPPGCVALRSVADVDVKVTGLDSWSSYVFRTIPGRLLLSREASYAGALHGIDGAGAGGRLVEGRDYRVVWGASSEVSTPIATASEFGEGLITTLTMPIWVWGFPWDEGNEWM